MLKFFKYCFVVCLAGAVLAGVVGAAAVYYLVVLVPSPELDESHIAEILSRESPVYYGDGTTKIGVLFEGTHRQYLKYDQLPKQFINALLASEDDEFFTHHGVDIPGIIRAMIANFHAGRVVQGGSTITQQTAKNLFKRESRSIEAKLKELLYAMKLEHRYSKEKILEFYCNQFFVSGTGHGLGVAARYFFDKDPSELTPLEDAFIAGSVKQPNYYNPFLRKNKENPDEVRRRDEDRVRYVLGQMRKHNRISDDQYTQLMHTLESQGIDFHQGRMSYAQNTVMDLVRDGLETPFIVDDLEEHGISNISTSGVHIITSLDKDLQQKTLQALRRQLSLLDVRLRGYRRADVQQEYQAINYTGDDTFLPGDFVFGTVGDITTSRDHGPSVQVLFQGHEPGVISGAGFARLSAAYVNTKSTGRVNVSARQALLRQLQRGDKVYVSIRGTDDAGVLQLDLEKYPKVEGAAYVLQNGAVRAMGGGMSNVNYNRATTARRPMGSTFKIFLYTAAMQLGWNPVDFINNVPQTFSFLRQAYSPQPDHHSPFGKVTLAWAGVTSENVASVWLLYHLTDRLNLDQIKEVAAQVDMAPRVADGVTETYQHYKQRMRERFGIVATSSALEPAAFAAAVQNMKPDFAFSNHMDEYDRIASLDYSRYQGLRDLAQKLNDFRQSLIMGANMGPVDPDLAFDNPDAAMVQYSSGRMVQDTQGRFIFTTRSTLPEQWHEMDRATFTRYLTALPPSLIDDFWDNKILLDGVLPINTVALIGVQMGKARKTMNDSNSYNLDVLSGVRDFRVMLGLQYMVRLAKACGIDSDFKPVLSMTLGSNVVSLSEMTRLYETIVTGFRHDAADEGTMAEAQLDGHVDPDAASIIERIETPEGRVVYNRQVYKARVVDARTSAAACNIMQNVIRYGTGHYATDHVSLHSDNPQQEKKLERLNQSYPVIGKTGTANDYRNAAFLGYVPVLSKDQGGLSLEDGYVVGVYTGFDANMPMVKGGFRVTGAHGALPVWCDIAQSILDVKKIGDQIDPVDLTFDGLSLQYPDVGEVFLPVVPGAGGAPSGGSPLPQQTAPDQPATLTFSAGGAGGRFVPARQFQPFWKNK